MMPHGLAELLHGDDGGGGECRGVGIGMVDLHLGGVGPGSLGSLVPEVSDRDCTGRLFKHGLERCRSMRRRSKKAP